MSCISDFSPFRFNEDQQIAVGLIEDFIEDDAYRVFILKGNAGTGKTTLIEALIKYLKAMDIPVVLLASTGRAAKIVGEKSQYESETVHHHIYTLDVEKNDDENKIRRLIFKLRINPYPLNTVYIVDECSMLSDHATGGVFIDYGSGKLLSDFFFYLGNRKVIFSGDPSQLPPVNTAFSPALSKSYLVEKHHKTVMESALRQVMRYSERSGIYQVVSGLRNQIENKQFGYLSLKVSGYSDFTVFANNDTMVEAFVNQLRRSGIDDSVFLCYTNAMAAELNSAIRSLLHSNKPNLVKGELLMVMQNNYKLDLANGEHLQVVDFNGTTESRAGITFRGITAFVKDVNGQRLVKGLLAEDLLYAREPAFTAQQEYELFKDFAIRMKNRGIKPKDPEYLSEMLTDPFLNAIRAKFGYAVTGHKAQGGEWNHVFILPERSLFNPTARENQFRWMYTAISRAITKVYFLSNYCLK